MDTKYKFGGYYLFKIYDVLSNNSSLIKNNMFDSNYNNMKFFADNLSWYNEFESSVRGSLHDDNYI